MFNRSEILRSAWADYRRDASKGWGCSPKKFSREHFAYCLRMAWAVTKEVAAKAANAAAAVVTRRADLIAEAGRLNNHPALVNVDHVTFMGFLDLEECERHVAKLRDMTKPKPTPAVAARIDALRSEIIWQEHGERIDWTAYRAASAELATLTA